MNQQRIMELWEQANSQYYQSESDQPLPQFIFAELIVRECAELTLSHRNDDYYNGWLDYRDEIKQHFGVEQ